MFSFGKETMAKKWKILGKTNNDGKVIKGEFSFSVNDLKLFH